MGKEETYKNAYNVQGRESLNKLKKEKKKGKKMKTGDILSACNTKITFNTKIQDFLHSNEYMGERKRGKKIKSHSKNLSLLSFFFSLSDRIWIECIYLFNSTITRKNYLSKKKKKIQHYAVSQRMLRDISKRLRE